MKLFNNPKVSVVKDRVRLTILMFVGILAALVGLICVLAGLFPSKKAEAPAEQTVETAGSGGEEGELSPVWMAVIGGVLIVAGGYCIYHSVTRKKLISKFKEYVGILDGDPENSLCSIKAATGEDISLIKKNVRKMIKRGYFFNAVIDEDDNKLLINKESVFEILARKAELGKVENIKVVKCPSCGASTEVYKGMTARCSYCGSAIEG